MHKNVLVFSIILSLSLQCVGPGYVGAEEVSTGAIHAQSLAKDFIVFGYVSVMLNTAVDIFSQAHKNYFSPDHKKHKSNEAKKRSEKASPVAGTSTTILDNSLSVRNNLYKTTGNQVVSDEYALSMYVNKDSPPGRSLGSQYAAVFQSVFELFYALPRGAIDYSFASQSVV